jgi:uncharacterized RDD family membrane protein YckC
VSYVDRNAPAEVIGRRIAAALIDLIALFVLLIIVGVIFKQGTASHGRAAVRLHGLSFWIWVAVLILYYWIPEATTGQTLGKKLLGIRVVSADGGPKPNAGRILIRTVLRVIDGFFFYLLGLIVILVTRDRAQRLGDLAAGTTVTRVRSQS